MSKRNLNIEKLQKVPVQEYVNNVCEKPLVSVCVQTYQHVDYISQCLDSILMQKTDLKFEILLGEDASTDGTRDICIEYAKKHPDIIKLFLHSRDNVIFINGSPSGRFNFLYNLHQAKGKYIAICEGDDYWTDPYKLQKQVDFLEENEDFVICYHNFTIIDNHENIFKDNFLGDNHKGEYSKEELMKGPHIPTLTRCFRNIIRTMPQEMLSAPGGDRCLSILLGEYGKAKYLGNEILPAVYRQHSKGIWSAKSDEIKYNMMLQTTLSISNYYIKKHGFEYAKQYLIYDINERFIKPYISALNNIQLIKRSYSYRIGRRITFPIRFLKSIIKIK